MKKKDLLDLAQKAKHLKFDDAIDFCSQVLEHLGHDLTIAQADIVLDEIERLNSLVKFSDAKAGDVVELIACLGEHQTKTLFLKLNTSHKWNAVNLTTYAPVIVARDLLVNVKANLNNAKIDILLDDIF